MVLPVAFLAGIAWLSYRHVQDDARAGIQRAVAAAEAHALKVVDTNRLLLDHVNSLVNGLSWEEIFARSAEIHATLKALDKRFAEITALHVVAPDGRLAAISVGYPTPQVNLSDRAYFQQHAAGAPGLVFGEPVVGRSTGLVSFTMSRSRESGAAAFDGVIVGSIRPSDFQAYWNTLAAGADAHFALVRADGQVLAHSQPPSSHSIRLPEGGALAQALSTADEGLVLEDPALNGTARLIGFGRVGDHPLFVTYGLSVQSVWRNWLERVALYGLVCAGFAALLAFTTLSVTRRWQAEQEARVRLERTADELRSEIARREAAEADLRAAHRLEALGRLTGGVAHDFNNLLTAILGTVQSLDRHLGAAADEKSRRLLAIARSAVERGARLNASLLAFARRQPLRLVALEANALLQDFVPLLRRALGETVTLELDLDPAVPHCRADAAQLEAALLNLAINARDAMPRGGEARLRTRQVRLEPPDLAGNADAAPGDYVLIELRDSGEGMTAEVRERAFEPFFTTKPVGRGTGLGLSQVFGFARQAGGHIAIESHPGEGTAVRLYLPVEPEAAAPAPQPQSLAPARLVCSGKITVLVVEDDDAVRSVAAEALRGAGFRVLTARNGPEALSILRSTGMVDVLFSDVVMPGGMTGLELARTAQRLRPGLSVLLASGYASEALVPHATAGEFELITKPYDQDAVARRIAELAVQAGTPA